MPLPKITTAEYELKLPSSGKAIKYRPFLVKEEKILILSLESQDNKQITNAVKQVLKQVITGVKQVPPIFFKNPIFPGFSGFDV